MTISFADQRSRELYARAVSRMPGGVNHPARAMRSVGRAAPLFIARGVGAMIHDVDGNQLIDYVCSRGALIAGHAHPDVVAAVGEAITYGTGFGAPTAGEVELAEEVSRRVPSVELMRMTSSATGALVGAVRLARAATGRVKILRFIGARHGEADGLLAGSCGEGATVAPAGPGVLAEAQAMTVPVPWNDGEAFVAACEDNELAAVVAEPYVSGIGLMPPVEGFLELLAGRTREAGALLIFDEVATGFRVAVGGAQTLTGVEPDLTVLGKVLGGGVPAAAFGGGAALMERVEPSGDVRQGSALSGNPLATASGLATLGLLDDVAYVRLAATTEQLAAGLRAAADEAGVPVVVHSAPGILSLFFAAERPSSHDGARACDDDLYAAFWEGLLVRGVYAPGSQYEPWFPSLAHTPEQVESTIAAAQAALAELAA